MSATPPSQLSRAPLCRPRPRTIGCGRLSATPSRANRAGFSPTAQCRLTLTRASVPQWPLSLGSACADCARADQRDRGLAKLPFGVPARLGLPLLLRPEHGRLDRLPDFG